LVRFVGVDDAPEVLVLLAILLEVWKKLQAWVADREVDVLAAVGDALRRGCARLRSEDGVVPAAVAFPDHPHEPLCGETPPTDAVRLALEGTKDLPCLRGVVVGEDGLGEDLPERSQELRRTPLAERLTEGVA